MSVKLKSLIATKRATFKLPAGKSGWPVPPRALLGRVLAGPRWATGCTTICSMNRERAGAWASAPGLLSLPMPTLSALIFVHRGREGGRRGQQSHLPQQYHQFVPVHTVHGISAVCQIDSPLPDLHWANTAVSAHQR